MLPVNIDLTENRDFNPSNNEIVVHGGFEPFDFDLISLEQYLNLCAWEKVFGISYRISEKDTVFFHSSLPLETEYCCARCGKRIFPWYGKELCPDCNKELEETFGEDKNKRFPWSVGNYESHTEDNNINLFGLR